MAFSDDLREAVSGPCCLVGIGNEELGDDGLGVRLAESLAEDGWPVVVAGRSPERWVDPLSRAGYRSVLLLDAVDVPGAPGSAVLLGAGAIRSRFPQVSTHRISLGTLARLIEAGGARVSLLGVKPAALAPGSGLSPAVRETLAALRAIFAAALPGTAGAGETGPGSGKETGGP